MKRFLAFFLILVFVVSCDEGEEETPNVIQDPEPRKLARIEIDTDRDFIIANTLDQAKIEYKFFDQTNLIFFDADADSIKNLVKLTVNNAENPNPETVVSEEIPGDLKIRASVGTIESDELTIPAKSVRIKIAASHAFLYANGKANISIEPDFISEDGLIIEPSQLTLLNENGIEADYQFSTTQEGTYTFKLVSGSIESEEISIEAVRVADLSEEIRIPIVFHVVPLTGREIGEIGNPTNERIEAGVEMLNALFASDLYDYSIESPNFSIGSADQTTESPKVINDVNSNILAAGNISFYLADEPNFDTPGIIRYGNDIPKADDLSEFFKFVDDHILDTHKYLNIFLYPVSFGGATGIASHYPGTTADVGIPGLPIVNVDWKPKEFIWLWPNIAVNDGGEFGLGVLLSHEIAHYFGLFHVFAGDDFNGLPDNPCIGSDPDFVTDTYRYDRGRHISSPQPTESMRFRVMCNGQLEKSNNVMDYFFASWYPNFFSQEFYYETMFTHGQMERMYRVLKTSPGRKQLAGFASARKQPYSYSGIPHRIVY